MNRAFSVKIIFWIAFLMFPGGFFALENTEESKAKLEIIGRLEKWSKDFNAKNIPEVCGLFAKDLVASYPGTADRNYDDMCRQFKEKLIRSDLILRYEVPEIEQVVFAGDIVVVRLIWTLKTSQKDQPSTEIIREKGLDVFKRQKDGVWKILISYAYPIGTH